jgi:hypothetical protein
MIGATVTDTINLATSVNYNPRCMIYYSKGALQCGEYLYDCNNDFSTCHSGCNLGTKEFLEKPGVCTRENLGNNLRLFYGMCVL